MSMRRWAIAVAAVAAAGAPGSARAQTIEVGLAAPPARLDLGAGVLAMGSSLDSDVVAAVPGGLRFLAVAPDGSMRADRSVALGAGVKPVAVDSYSPVLQSSRVDLLVLDAASQRVLVLRGDPRHGYAVRTTVPAGLEPTGLTVVNFNGDRYDDLAVADAASNSVTVWFGNAGHTFGAPRTFAVGARPVGLLSDDLDADHQSDLAVADSAGRALTVLHGDGRGGVTRRSDIALPGAPVAVGEVAYDSNSLVNNDLDGDRASDLVVAYADAKTLSVLLGRRRDPTLTSTLTLPAAGHPVALATGEFGTHGFNDVAIISADPGAVTLLLSDGDGHLHAQDPTPIGGQPVGATVPLNNVAGDGRSDIFIADASGAVVDVIPGDRFLARAGPRGLLAGDGVLYYSAHIGHAWREQRLSEPQGATPPTAATLPIPASAEAISAYFGEDRRGHPELDYARCRTSHRCSAYAFALPDGPERSVRIQRPAGCRVDAFARSRAMAVYELSSAPKGSCPAAAEGLWAKTPRGTARALARHIGGLGFVRGDHVGYVDRLKGGVVRVRLATLEHRTVTLDDLSDGFCDGYAFGGPHYDSGYLYWAQECEHGADPSFTDMVRARLNTPRCASPITDWATGSYDTDFAVDHASISYSDNLNGLFAVTPGRLHWRQPVCKYH